MKEKLSKKQLQAFRYIRNCLVHSGRSPSVRELMRELGYGSPNSAAYMIESLINLGILQRRDDKKLQLAKDIEFDAVGERTVQVPLVGVVPCGAPVLADENIDAMIPVSEKLAKPPHRHFLLRAQGDSMDLAGINDGDLVLVRQQNTVENGQKVVALIDDEATVKEFYRQQDIVILRPKSTKPEYQPIVLTKDFQVQGVVVATLPDIN